MARQSWTAATEGNPVLINSINVGTEEGSVCVEGAESELETMQQAYQEKIMQQVSEGILQQALAEEAK